jgi:hypothetical protein
MSVTPRDQFLKHLKRVMVHGETASERLAATKMFGEMTFGMPADGKPSSDIALPDPPASTPKPLSEFAEAARIAMLEHPDGGLECLLLLVKPERWMQGSWARRPDGWFDVRTQTALTFDDARNLVDARIAELGLDAEKVYAHPVDRSMGAGEYTAFLNLRFSEQMRRFQS